MHNLADLRKQCMTPPSAKGEVVWQIPTTRGRKHFPLHEFVKQQENPSFQGYAAQRITGDGQ